MRPRLTWMGPILVLVLGVALGLVTQQATGTSSMLRIPALIASLLLVAHAVTGFDESGDARHDEDEDSDVVVSESTEVVRVQQINTPTPGRAIYSGVPSGETQITTTTKSERQTPHAMYFVMILSIWLGLATLANPGAPRLLLTLSLLAAFLLFADAYKAVRAHD